MEQIYGLLMLIGPAILAWQGYSWLKTGIWTALPISKTFTYFEWPMPSTNWLGLQKIIDWVFDIPTSLAVFVLSFIVMVICAIAHSLVENYLANQNPV
jgi:ABC-type cobalamin transport system permease subunit